MENFIASDDDIATLAKSVITGSLQADAGRKDYLKILLATTINALGAKPKARAARAGKVDEAETSRQLAALSETHNRFYTIIVRETGAVLDPGRGKAEELNRRTAYARVALSRIRGYATAGFDLTALVPARVTRDKLEVKREPRAASAARVKARAERESATLVATLTALIELDKDAALEGIQAAIGQLSDKLIAMGVVSTRDAAEAARDHIPLKVGRTLFVPTEVQRATTQPS